MKNTDNLAARERDMSLNISIDVGVDVLGMPLSLSEMTEADAEKWMKWHDKWEKMDEGTQDSYLTLLALQDA